MGMRQLVGAQSQVGWGGWDSRHSVLKEPQALCSSAAPKHLEVTPKVLPAASSIHTDLHVCTRGLLLCLS